MVTIDGPNGTTFQVPASIYLMQQNMTALLSQQQKTMTETSEDSKSHLKSMPTFAQNTLLYGQIREIDTCLPSRMTEACRELFKQKNTATFHTTIHHHILSGDDDKCEFYLGQIGIIQRHGLRWQRDEEPSGNSPFSLNPWAIPGSYHSQKSDTIEIVHQETLAHQNGLKASHQLREIYAKQDLFIPITCEEYRIQLRTFWLWLSRLLGSESILAQTIYKAYCHFTERRQRYQAGQEDDFTFLARALFTLDQTIQLFICHYLSNPTTRDSICSRGLNHQIDRLFDDIEHRRPLARLPTFAMEAIRARREKDRASNQGDNRNNRDNSHRNSDPIAKRIKPEPTTFSSPTAWKINDPTQYGTVFNRQVLNTIPTLQRGQRQVPYCNKLFSTGHCRLGATCRFIHSDPSQHGKTEALNRYFRDAYQHTPPAATATTARTPPDRRTTPGTTGPAQR
jgi:hypothetical protein